MDSLSIEEILGIFGLGIAVGSTVLAVISNRTVLKQFNHAVMISCITRFQEIIPHLNDPDTEKKRDAIRKYIDLCNEELFYFKSDYVPKEVVDEWLDGMISYLPLYNTKCDLISEGKFEEIIKYRMLEDYPRIQKAFRISEPIDLAVSKDRKRCTYEIFENLKRPENPCPEPAQIDRL